MAEMEIWRPVEGFEATHEVSSHGGVRTRQRRNVDVNGRVTTYPQKRLKTKVLDDVWVVTLCVDGKRWLRSLHVLVAKAFLPKPAPQKGSLLVRHLDGNSGNNHVRNLAWYYYNISAGRPPEHGIRPAGLRQVEQLDAEGAVVATHESVVAAAKTLGCDMGNIYRVLRGEWKHYKGWRWRYVSERKVPSTRILGKRAEEEEELT